MRRVSETGRYFVDEAGRPAFWLADTAWNGVLCATDEQWQTYLQLRREQGFTVIQTVVLPWRGCARPPIGLPLRVQGSTAQFDQDVMARLDARLAAVVDAGLVPAPVMFWAYEKTDPGRCLKENQLIDLGRTMVERWSALHPIWLLAGDGAYTSASAVERWKRVGRSIFADHPDALASMHPGGLTWIGDDFAEEPWYRFVGIQSGHGTGEADLRFLLRGGWARSWPDIRKPFVNIEPNYEGFPAYRTKTLISAYHVRRATWWSLLTAPTAGITYGNNAIWNWRQVRGPSEGHAGLGEVDPWHDGLETEGIAQLQVMRRILDGVAWWQLRPASGRLLDVPGDTDLNASITVAQTEDASTTLAYLPCGGTLRWAQEPEGRARWVDPRDGQTCEASSWAAPDQRDWLLLIQR